MTKKHTDLSASQYILIGFFVLFGVVYSWIGAWGAIALVGFLILAYAGIRAAAKESEERSRADHQRISESASKRLIEDAIEKCLPLIESHKVNLALEKRRLVRRDAYGSLIAEQWENGPQGINYFINTVLKPALGEYAWSQALAHAHNHYTGNNDFQKQLVSLINKAADTAVAVDSSVDHLSGVDYEIFCEEVLSRNGWRVIRTPASGDQGVDLIATKGDIRACIQCKRHSKPIGNSAVQEVIAGNLFWEGTVAVVVSNAGYTLSARQLAEASSVLLIHQNDLTRLAEILPATQS